MKVTFKNDQVREYEYEIKKEKGNTLWLMGFDEEKGPFVHTLSLSEIEGVEE